MRVIYFNFFSRKLITGGIKISYRCAELLAESGHDAFIWQPDGAPGWLETSARVVTEESLQIRPGDILVIPEGLNKGLVEIARRSPARTKVMFCQNQYNIFNNPFIPAEMPHDLGFTHIFASAGYQNASSSASSTATMSA